MRLRRALFLTALLVAGADTAADGDHATILLYHRVAETGPASTRVTPARFAAHLDLVAREGYAVVPLATLLDSIFDGGPVPERAVAITFDDAYRSVADVAWPMLRERDMPFTVFVATDAVDDGGGAFLDWASIRAMSDSGLAAFGAHSRSHAHLESMDSDERAAQVDESITRLREKLGDRVLQAFAYPFGEYSRDTEQLLTERGLYGLAQQSGATGRVTPRTRIPRFPMYLGADSDERLRTALAARPLPVTAEAPGQVFFADGEEPPSQWRITPGEGPFRREALRCYAASGDALTQRWDDGELAISLGKLAPGRNKVNCTAPSTEGAGYFWYSRLWLIADQEGRWLLR